MNVPPEDIGSVDERPNTLSLEFVEALYADYLRDAESVSPDWRHYFDELSHAGGNGAQARSCISIIAEDTACRRARERTRICRRTESAGRGSST